MVKIFQQRNSPGPFIRRQGQAALQSAHVIHLDRWIWRKDIQVWKGSFGDETTGSTLAASFAQWIRMFTTQGLSKSPGQGAFPNRFRTDEQVGVTHSFVRNMLLEQPDRPLVTDKIPAHISIVSFGLDRSLNLEARAGNRRHYKAIPPGIG
jgi:hypothetical protein